MDNNHREPESLEVMFQQLEGLLAELESEEVSLEKSFSLYNQGMQTIKKCSETIDTIEKKVQIIDQNGEFHEF
ncbi:MAG: exodeoxyribonuclease VII small subunit [Eubacteriales bacterium]